MKTEKFSAENKWQQTQSNEKMGKCGKSKLKNIQTQDMQIIHYELCFSGNIWLWLLSQNGCSKMAPFWHQNL
jgi:hypothetical protein